jgi:hypothetical protein
VIVEIEIEIPDEVIQDMKIGQPFNDSLLTEIIVLNCLTRIDEDYSEKCPLTKKWIAEQDIETRALQVFKDIVASVDIEKLKEAN